MWLLHSPDVHFIEGHLLVCSFLLKRRYHVDIIQLSLACFLEGFERPSCEGYLGNYLYLPNHVLCRLEQLFVTPGRGPMLALIAIPELIIFSLLHVFL